ncbi:helix-turn-helix domain protein [Caldicellulosiruptor owensensis OL]|uniref:Helix-turn-helix domain protein n=1 Tax=Caldicellulosiruptor owensensis (strain ATCC 700167 / DSM 13100 / OL) TaxID=632518 RepID=E4Q3Y7_CALOW|nr:helix-turn-helix transcriptional regulator [Caldicellulosiruptor owensensis]ADQ04022.1 helix-turn-helix domain protein [Caldicellulosiruptor owensensis OL]
MVEWMIALDERKRLEEFGLKIRILREEKRISQKELAKRLEISPQALANYEKGKRMPGINILVRLSEELDVSIDFLLGLTDIRKPKSRMVKEHLEMLENIQEKEEILSLIEELSNWEPEAVKIIERFLKRVRKNVESRDKGRYT